MINERNLEMGLKSWSTFDAADFSLSVNVVTWSYDRSYQLALLKDGSYQELIGYNVGFSFGGSNNDTEASHKCLIKFGNKR